jgi:hypothetical protein
MYKEIKVLDVATLQPITNAEVMFFDENGNYFKPWNKTNSQGIVSVEDPRAERGNKFSVKAPGYHNAFLNLSNLESWNDGLGSRAQSGMVYLIDSKSYIENIKKANEQQALNSGQITLEEIRIWKEKERIANEAQIQLNKITGIVNGTFQGVSYSLSARLTAIISSTQKLTQSPYSNVREGSTQLFEEAQNLQARVATMEKDLNQIIKDYQAEIAEAKAKQLASLKK